MSGNGLHAPYRIVDVFTTQRLEGNPLAVFTDGSSLDDRTMQKIAQEMNLSETAFILPPTRRECAARVRIFTPWHEMPFAGHPTVGTCFVLFDEGIISETTTQFSLEEQVGPVPIRVEHGRHPMFWLTTPRINFSNTYERARCAAALGLSLDDLLDVKPQALSAGNPTLYIAVRDRAAVDRAWMDLSALEEFSRDEKVRTCAYVFTPTSGGAYSRMFAANSGIPEDPATGSSAGPLCAYMMQNRLVSDAPGTRMIIEQGTKMGRRSLLHVLVGKNGIEVGGNVAPLSECVMTLDATELRNAQVQ